jgi:hypothetical protein
MFFIVAILNVICSINTNYLSWMSYMEYLLRSRALFRISLEMKFAPLDALKKDKWDNKIDKAHKLIGMSLSPYMFHLTTTILHLL